MPSKEGLGMTARSEAWLERYEDAELKILQVKDFVQYWEEIGTEQEEMMEEIADAVYDHLRKALRQMEFYHYEMKKMYRDDRLPPTWSQSEEEL